MKVCLITDEYFSWGVHGGFGFFTRKLGKELVQRGIDVEAIVHHISDSQKPIGETEIIDGVPVTTLPRKKLAKLRSKLYETDADIIHSQSGMFDTYLAFKRNPKKKKIVTFQDPRAKAEMALTMPYESLTGYAWYKKLWGRFVFRLYKRSVQKADLTASQAIFKIPVVRKMFDLKTDAIWLPNMVDVPDSPPSQKSSQPMCVFTNRLDPIKRPEIYCSMAKLFPDVEFYVLSRSHIPGRDEKLHAQFKEPNIHFTGFVDEDTKHSILERAWVSVNSSIYECLPIAFLESAAYGCSILSWVNPDNFTSNYGYHVKEATVESFAQGLGTLLKNDNWRELGRKAYFHAKQYYNTPIVTQQHIDLYKRLLE